MNHLILNRDFRLPDDGWYHIAPLGEFPHAGAGVIQVIDQEACVAMAARFAADANTPNLKGMVPLSNSSRDHRLQTSDHRPVDFQTLDGKAQQKGSDMKAVIEKLVNHLGLAADATEALILEKMGGL